MRPDRRNYPQISRVPFDIGATLAKYDPDQKLDRYFAILMNENAKVNLVSRETSPADLRRLSAESLLPLDVMKTPVESYLDIGSGGGLPSIPIILADRSVSHAVLVERTLKKADALVRILSALKLRVDILPRSFEEIRLDRKFELVTLRWVKLSSTLLKRIANVLTPGGCLVHYSYPLSGSTGLEIKPYEFVCPESSATKQFTIYYKKTKN